MAHEGNCAITRAMPSTARHRRPSMRFVFVLLSLLLLLGSLPGGASAAEKGIETDLTWAISNTEADATVAGVQDLGASWMRLTMSWHDIETQKGSYTGLAGYDNAISKAASAGTKIVVTVYTAPSWASGVADRESPPRDPADYADFMRFAAQRWGDKVDAWEVWNEQNLWGFWSTGPDPAQYAQLLKTAYPAIKAVDPTASVLYGGVSYNDYRFLEGAYAAVPNLGDYYDVMATHPYSPTNAPEDVWYDPDGRLAKKSFVAYREIRDVMLANGDDKPIWFTEFGWSTNSLADWGVSEAQQADYYTRAMRCVEQDPYVQVAIWYIYRNHAAAADADTWVDQLGLLRTDFSKKPAYDAFKNYTPGSVGCDYAYPPPAEPAPESPLPPALEPPAPVSAVPGAPETIAGPTAPLAGQVPKLAVRRAQMRRGQVTIDGRVVRGATGRVRGIAVHDGKLHRFAAPIDADGRFRVRKAMRDGSAASAAWIALIYRGDKNFQKQWVILQAAPRPAQLRLQPAATASRGSRSRAVRGTVNPQAQGSVVLALFYRTATGRPRRTTAQAKIRDGVFEHVVRVPENARRAVVHVVFPGDPNRGIGGGSATLLGD